MPHHGSTVKELRIFLQESFTTPQLEQFLIENGLQAAANAVNKNVGVTEYCFKVVQELDQLGLIGVEFFEHLSRERGEKAARIRVLEQQWADGREADAATSRESGDVLPETAQPALPATPDRAPVRPGDATLEPAERRILEILAESGAELDARALATRTGMDDRDASDCVLKLRGQSYVEVTTSPDGIRARAAPLGRQAHHLYRQAMQLEPDGRTAPLPRRSLSEARVGELALALSRTAPLQAAEGRRRVAARLAARSIVLGDGLRGIVALIREEAHGVLIEAVEAELAGTARETLDEVRLILQETREDWLPTRSQRREAAQALAHLTPALRPEELWPQAIACLDLQPQGSLPGSAEKLLDYLAPYPRQGERKFPRPGLEFLARLAQGRIPRCQSGRIAARSSSMRPTT